MQLNDEFIMISNWAYQWKMSFNPEVTKQAQELVKVRNPLISLFWEEISACAAVHMRYTLDLFNHGQSTIFLPHMVVVLPCACRTKEAEFQ